MTKRTSTLALIPALVAIAFVALPSEALAQYGHYGHGYRYGYGHSYYDYGYRGYGPSGPRWTPKTGHRSTPENRPPHVAR